MIKRKKVAEGTTALAADFRTLGNGVLDLIGGVVKDHWSPDSAAGQECADDPVYAAGFPFPDAKPVTDAHLDAVTSLVALGDTLRGMADCVSGQSNLVSTISLARVATSVARVSRVSWNLRWRSPA